MPPEIRRKLREQTRTNVNDLDWETRMMFLGGDALEGPRHLWWNFVSSSKERIEQAKQDWKTGRFAHVPDESEFIPLPE
jgi:redox-sensitive bicupin YhaK (pirin superfamily)